MLPMAPALTLPDSRVFDALERDVRLHIYQQLVETSCAPTPPETAKALDRDAAEVENVYLALARARVIVLRPDTTTVWMAMPFSNLPTPFNVISGGRAYYAPCAWDAFGIAALLGEARIFTTCPDCGGALERKISRGCLTDARGVVHFAVPARDWWVDVGYT